MEEWKPIIGFEEYYLISNMGRVASLVHRFGKRAEPRIMRARRDGGGYHQAALSLNGEKHYPKIHRLVCLHFLPNPSDLPQINHIDENKDNNCVSNLEWCTGQHNIQHTFSKHYKFISPEGDEVEIFNLLKFCRENHLTNSNMLKVYSGERAQHKGWKKCL